MSRLLSRGAQREFEAFAAKVTDRLMRSGYLLTWSLQETEDVVQETLLRVARNWTRVKAMDQPEAYARRVLVNVVIDGTRRRERRRAELGADADFSSRADVGAHKALDCVDLVAECRWALAQLPPRQRAVVVLRYWEDLSEAEVADILGCPVGTVKSVASRGTARLRELLRRAEADRPAPKTFEKHERRPAS